MKDEVLKRGMFSQPMSKSARNSGIMEGFEDEMEDEGTPPLARSPQNPEILMNNLRGDMRSVDARYLELAQMVGEEAAMETPPEVLAMLQPQLAAQTAPAMPQGGIGALPQGAQMAPPPMMGQGPAMPPGMEGMPPFPQGGAEQAPPTPDGMPPLRAAGGTLVSEGARFASQGFGKIGSALYPYLQGGMNYLDELITPFTRPTMRVERMTEDGRQAVIQGRENIVQGPRGPEFSTGTRLEAANTLGFGQIPFSQAVRESSLGNLVRTYPRSTIGGTTALASTIYGLSGDRSAAPRTAAELERANNLINQIPGQGPALRDSKGNSIAPPWEEGFTDSRFPPTPPERPEDATINRLNTEPVIDFTPFASMGDKTTKGPLTTGPAKVVDISNKTFIDENLLKENEKEKPLLTRAQRIKAEYQETEPLFRELLGDTKSTTRTNALLLLADAGFKFASTYKPTMAMALADAFSGVPKGFAAIVAQAKDSGIKIKTAALQQAVSNVDTQDKISRDVMLQRMRDSAFRDRALINATSKREVEELKARFKEREIILTGDQNRLTEAWKWGQPEIEDVGGGIQMYKWKNGETYTTFDKNSDIPTRFLESRYTNKQATNPYVTYRGPSAMTPLRDKASVKTALDDISSYDLALREVDNLRTKVLGSYSPGTWAVDKYNNILVPLTFNTVTPLVKEEALSSAIKLSAESISKSIASAGQSGRLSNQNIQYAREALDSLLNPTNFMKNPELAASVLSTLETRLRNGRQAVGEQLGYIKDDLVADIPATGSQNNPFIYGAADSEQAARMDMYLKNLYKGQDPNVPVYVNINGQTGRTTIGKILQAR